MTVDLIQLLMFVALVLNLLSFWYNYRTFRAREGKPPHFNLAVVHGNEVETRMEIVRGTPTLFIDLKETKDGP